ncbi:hypothetical protein [Corynebacterium sp. LK2510]|uniref:hypothetical protein n=1 Tax=Corynebacterium sp. LK2510 TaxID=3110472 RepID=UPI0034CEC1D4
MINYQLLERHQIAYRAARQFEENVAQCERINRSLKRKLELPHVSQRGMKWWLIIMLLTWAYVAYVIYATTHSFQMDYEEWQTLYPGEVNWLLHFDEYTQDLAEEVALEKFPVPTTPLWAPESMDDLPFYLIVLAILVVAAFSIPLIGYMRQRDNLGNLVFGDANRRRAAQNAPLQAEIARFEGYARENVRAYLQTGYPEAYLDAAVLEQMGRFIASGRATSFQQAANLYEASVQNRRHMNELRRLESKMDAQHRARMMSDFFLRQDIQDLRYR